MAIRISLLFVLMIVVGCEDDVSDIVLTFQSQDQQEGEKLEDAQNDELDQIMHQAEQLFQDENPLIEQMLQLAQGLGDGGDDTKILLMLEDPKDQEVDIVLMEEMIDPEEPQDEHILVQVDDLNDSNNEQLLNDKEQVQSQVPDFAVLQSPISDSTVTQNHQYKSPRVIIQEEKNSEDLIEDTKQPNWIVQCEFIVGAVLVFSSITMLWQIEARLLRRKIIKSTFKEFINKKLIVYVNGLTETKGFITDSFSGLQVENCLRLYRKVEKQIGSNTWTEIDDIFQGDNDLRSFKQNCSKVKINQYHLSHDLIFKMNNWEPLPINNDIFQRFQNNDGNFIYLDQKQTMRISFFVIPSSTLSVVSGLSGRELSPIVLHLPKQDDDYIDEESNYCEERFCTVVNQWIEQGEWDENIDQISMIQKGIKSIDQMVQFQLHKMAFGVKTSRMIVFAILCLGVQLFFLPIFQVLKLFPIFGVFVDYIGAWIGSIVGILFALVFSLTTTGISYSLYKPKKGFFLIFLALCICLVLIACTHFDYQIDPKYIFNLI